MRPRRGGQKKGPRRPLRRTAVGTLFKQRPHAAQRRGRDGRRVSVMAGKGLKPLVGDD